LISLAEAEGLVVEACKAGLHRLLKQGLLSTVNFQLLL
jgi:hypothetical protein